MAETGWPSLAGTETTVVVVDEGQRGVEPGARAGAGGGDADGGGCDQGCTAGTSHLQRSFRSLPRPIVQGASSWRVRAATKRLENQADAGAAARKAPSRIASRRGAHARRGRRRGSRRSTVGAAAGGEAREQLDHVGAGLRVEVAGRLVGEDHPRLDRPARGRSRRAAARRPRAAPGDARRGRRARPRRAARERCAQLVAARRRSGASPISTFCSAVSVGIRLNCWNTNPNASQPQLGELAVPQRPRGRGPRRTPGRRSAGRARRGAGAASSCPIRSGPRARRTRRQSICRSTPSTRAHLDRAPW